MTTRSHLDGKKAGTLYEFRVLVLLVVAVAIGGAMWYQRARTTRALAEEYENERTAVENACTMFRGDVSRPARSFEELQLPKGDTTLRGYQGPYYPDHVDLICPFDGEKYDAVVVHSGVEAVCPKEAEHPR